MLSCTLLAARITMTMVGSSRARGAWRQGTVPLRVTGLHRPTCYSRARARAPLAGKRKQSSASDKCFKCGGTGHWSRECPNAHSSSDNQVGHLHSITSDPVVSAIATGANAVPIRPQVRSLLERVKRKTSNKLIASVDDGGMTDVHAIICMQSSQV